MGVVIKDCANILVAVPDFVRYGSKPSRDIESDPALLNSINAHLRKFDHVLSYAPNQAFIGNMKPDQLHTVSKPWYEHPVEHPQRIGSFGEILPEDEFYGWLKASDDFKLVFLETSFIEKILNKFASHPLITKREIAKIKDGVSIDQISNLINDGSGMPLFYDGALIGAIKRDHDKDDTLKAEVLLENLMAKASGTFAMRHLFKRAGLDPLAVDFVIDCTETAVGDRYNRGGGSLSKAMAEQCGCLNATGHDVRAFCCGPTHAIISAAAMVESGIFNNVVVVGGGCLAKLGMKFSAHLKHNMPILEDVLGGIALLIAKDDGISPKIRLDSIGKHDVGAGSSQEAILKSLIARPLEKVGLRMIDVDKFATELHNPEVTLPAGSGDTPLGNYKLMSALAVLRKEIQKSEMDDFVRKHGMPGYCPTQGHIPSAVPFLGHALQAMANGELKRVLFVAKGSLFLGRMSQLSDGVSFLLEANTTLS
jgi:glycine/sarcosine/betaine reductase complex component C subunit beta